MVLALILIPLAALLFGADRTAQADAQGVRVTLDGQETPLDVPGLIRNVRTLVPFRAIFEALGATVSWEPETRTVTVQRGADVLVLTVGNHVVEWRRSLIRVDVAPAIVSGRTLVPLRFVSQALGLGVRWDEATATVHLERTPADAVLARGIRIVHEKSCMVCHTINGAGGNIGPTLNGVTERYSEDWLRDPQAVRSDTRMPTRR